MSCARPGACRACTLRARQPSSRLLGPRCIRGLSDCAANGAANCEAHARRSPSFPPGVPLQALSVHLSSVGCVLCTHRAGPRAIHALSTCTVRAKHAPYVRPLERQSVGRREPEPAGRVLRNDISADFRSLGDFGGRDASLIAGRTARVWGESHGGRRVSRQCEWTKRSRAGGIEAPGEAGGLSAVQSLDGPATGRARCPLGPPRHAQCRAFRPIGPPPEQDVGVGCVLCTHAEDFFSCARLISRARPRACKAHPTGFRYFAAPAPAVRLPGRPAAW